ncbi:unnamed protein product [Caenorhabditis bovis]|uniref:PDZ domain-containing protein n=1 Tax=Caenorhabditis bovis TaxID=2654633 RepID=A0A8S1FD78_9PELO|nr:unnamed protein product [Caenorhabditis bovis]
MEKEDRRRAIEKLQKELNDAEQRWMEKVRKVVNEREELARKVDEFEEKIDSLKRQVHRSETYKMEFEETNQRLRKQYEALQRDYEDTMQERSIVLEENARLIEERDKLQIEILRLNENYKHLESEKLNELKKKLDQTRKLLQVNMEETVTINAQKDAALAKIAEIEEKGEILAEERDEALRKCQQSSNEALVDIWNTHSVQISLPFPKPNLGLVLGGGRTDDGTVHGPIYVKHIALVVRRRSNFNRIIDVCLPLNHGVGLELANGVFVNSCEPNGAASRSGLAPGQRIVHVMYTPVYDAKHAEMLIKNACEPLVIGILQSNKKYDITSKDKQRTTIFSRWFGRSVDKERNVIAKANIERNNNDSSLFRQGSLRIPQTNPLVSPLVRYGSLRAPNYSNVIDQKKLLMESIESPNKKYNAYSTTHSEVAVNPYYGSSSAHKDHLVYTGSNVESIPCYVPKNSVFSSPTSPVSRFIRQNSDLKCKATNSSRCVGWDGRSFSSATTATSEIGRPYSMHCTPKSSTLLETQPNRQSVYSPTQVYQLNREDSLSSVMSSSNSFRLPSASYYINNSECNLKKEGNQHKIDKEDSDISLSLDASTSKVNTSSHVDNLRSKRPLDPSRTPNYRNSHHDEVAILVNRPPQPRLIGVPRFCVRLCGGNAIGIIAETSVAPDLLEGDLILEIDGKCVRNTTLESAVTTLMSDDDDITRLLVQDGGDRLNRLRLGADGDSFFLRVNIDRNVENKDELELKAGDVVFVDKTMYLGKKGRWRAWKVDKEGRQREHGAIPSSSSVYQSIRTNRMSNPYPRKAYEWVEKLDTKIKRPILLFGALLEPFVQMLTEESDKFALPPTESINASFDEITSLIREHVIIDSKQNDENDQLHHVIFASQIRDITTQGLHCVLHVDPVAIERLRQCGIYPIIIKIRFKSAKQLKDINEHVCGEKITSKEGKQLIEKDLKLEKEIDGAVTLVVPSHNSATFMLSHSLLQLKKMIEDEQKKTVWIQRKTDNDKY